MFHVILFVVVAAGCAAASALIAGSVLTAPARRKVATPADLPVEAVTIHSESGANLAGWTIEGKNPRGVVVLLHGVRGSRLDLVARARFLAKAGFAIVMFDFQGHGMSTGDRITFGFLESSDSRAAVNYARQRFPGKPIGVIGGSMGGAAALLANPPLAVNALVLEAVYPTIEDAVCDRIELATGKIFRWMSPLLTMQLKPRIGCCAADLCPISRLPALRVPKLFMAGTRDRHTTIAESREMYRQAAEPKAMWEIEGAAHQDFYAYRPAEYERRVLTFFSEHLK